MDAQQLKTRLNTEIVGVLQHLLPAGKVKGHEFAVGSINGDAGESLKVEIRGAKAGVWADFSDGSGRERGDILDLWQHARGISFAETIKEAQAYLGIHNVDRPLRRARPAEPSVEKVQRISKSPVIKYLEGRGLSPETIAHYRVRAYDRESDTGRDHMAFRFWDSEGHFVMLKTISIVPRPNGKKDTWSTPPYYTLFGWWLVPENCRRICICEGEVDAMTLYQLGMDCPVLSVPAGASNCDWIENDYDRLNHFEEILICTDMDTPGEACASTIANRLGMSRCVRIPMPKPHKDANACLMSGDDRMADLAQWPAPYHFQPSTICTALQLLADLQAMVRRDYDIDKVSTFLWPKFPFQFRPGEMTILTGFPHSGKSNFMYQTHLHEMAMNERVLFCSYEISPTRMLAEITRMMQGKDPSNDDLEAATKWLDGRLWFIRPDYPVKFSDLERDITYSVRRFGVSRVAVDSLHFLTRKEDYEGQDQLCRDLFQLAVSLNLHILLVAHAKIKIGEDKIPGMADVEGSGGISKPPDNGITVWRNCHKRQKLEKAEDEEDEHKRETAESMHDTVVAIWKQRRTGKMGRLRLWFDPETKLFRTTQQPIQPGGIPAQQNELEF